MQYLISVIDDTTNSATAAEMKAIGEYNDWLVEEGNWVFAGGLAAPTTATVIDARSEEAAQSSGPFMVSTEHVSGFWIIEARDRAVAISLATEASKHCHRRVELRPFL